MMCDFDRSRLSHNTSQDRFEKPLKTVLSSQRARPANPPANERKSSENHKRNGHRRRRFVDMLLHMLVRAGVAEECKKEQPEHVKGGHSGGDETDNPQEEKGVECLAEDFIFAEKSGEGKNSCNRQGRNRERLRGNG